MRSIAASKIARPAAFITLVLAVGSCALAQHQAVQCPCSDPPGGVITCEKGQLATCTVVKGKVEGRCQTPPADLTDKLKMDAWTLGQVTSRPVGTDETKNPEFQSILKSGRWQSGDKVVTFRMADGISILGSYNILGNISQQGENDIAQFGNNNQATINPKLSPYDTVIWYSLDGCKKLTVRNAGSIRQATVGGPSCDAFQKISNLERNQEWKDMLNSCKEEQAKEPQWPTAFLCAAEANIALGKLDDADKQIKQAKDIARTGEDYAGFISSMESYLEHARQQIPPKQP